MTTTRKITRALGPAPCSCVSGRGAVIAALFATGGTTPPGLQRADELAAQRGDADQPRAGVGADDGTHLRDDVRRPAVDRLPPPGELLRLLGRLDVLDVEAVRTVVAQRLEVVDHPLERAAPGPH